MLALSANHFNPIIATVELNKSKLQVEIIVMHQYQFSSTDPILILFRQKMADTWLIPILGT